MVMVDLKQHKRSTPHIQSKRKVLKLEDCNEKSIFDLSIYENEYFNTRFWKFIDLANENNGRKIKDNSKRFKELKKVILNIYLHLVMKIIIDTLLKGDKIIMFKKIFSMHITSLPTFKKFASKIRYKYIHAYSGVYPVIRVSLSERVMYSVSIVKRVHNRVMRLDAFYYPLMSSMISHKIKNENLKLNKEWATVLRSKKIKYESINHT
jgi:hypothetical protein